MINLVGLLAAYLQDGGSMTFCQFLLALVYLTQMFLAAKQRKWKVEPFVYLEYQHI